MDFENSDIIIDKNYVTYIEDGKKKRKKLPIDINKIHKQLAEMNFEEQYNELGRGKDKNEAFENCKLPPIAYVYYTLYIREGNIPTMDEISLKYIEDFCDKVENGLILKTEYKKSSKEVIFTETELKARIARAYNSYNREIELLAQLSNKFDCRYSFIDDYYGGIDITVEYKGNKYGLATYIDSYRSNFYRCRKTTTRHDFSDKYIITVPARMKAIGDKLCNMDYCGDIAIYSYDAVKEVIKDIVTADFRQSLEKEIARIDSLEKGA